MMAMRMMALMVIVAGSTACAGDKPKPPVAVADSGPPQWAGYVQRSIAAAIGDSTSRIEGIAAAGGNLYVADWKDGGIYRLSPVANSPAPLAEVERVGQLPTKPGTTIFGVAADKSGNLYFAIPEAGIVYRADGARLGRNFDSRKDVTVFATGMKGANGLGFDANGHLWSSGGDQNVLYHVDAKGGAARVFAKDYATVSSDTTMPVRAFVTNGIAFDKAGNAYTANTGTGEIQRLEVKPGYKPGAITTLVKSPLLLGADGLMFDDSGNLFVTANYRNALLLVMPDGNVQLVTNDRPGHRADSAQVRVSPEGGHMGETGVLRFPAEIARVGNTIYLANLNFKVGANTEQSFTGASVAGIRIK
jgi:sugar lactone lactonase YvrE